MVSDDEKTRLLRSIDTGINRCTTVLSILIGIVLAGFIAIIGSLS